MVHQGQKYGHTLKGNSNCIVPKFIVTIIDIKNRNYGNINKEKDAKEVDVEI